MKATTLGSFFMGAVSLLLFLPGCVSSKKYKTSQAQLQQVRSDSARLAQQVESLNGNVHAIEQKNASLQQSLDSTSRNYATTQKSLMYYQNYFDTQMGSVSQLSQELKDSLAKAGITDADLYQKNGSVYVTLDENNMFKRNSTAVTMKGKQAITDLATVLKNHQDNFVVSVDNNFAGAGTGPYVETDKATTTTRTTKVRHTSPSANSANADMSTTSTSGSKAPMTHHPKVAKTTAAPNTATDNSTANKASTATTTTTTATTVKAHKRHHPSYSSGESRSYTYTNDITHSGMSKSERAAWMLRSGRVNTVARGLLQNGVPKINLVLKNQPGASDKTATGEASKNGIQVVISPAMKDFMPLEKNSAVKSTNGNE